MRQTSEHRSYLGSRAALSRHGQIPACRSACRRRGFTLIEVVVAMSILVILLIALVGSFARGVAGFRQAQLMTFGQNLAEFQAEDLKSMPPSVLYLLVQGKYPGDIADPQNPLVKWSNYPYAADDTLPWRYDSGEIATDFNVVGLTTIVGGMYKAGAYPEGAPDLVGEPFLIGPNVEIVSYTAYVATVPFWNYYRTVLHKEAFPLFSKRITVDYYDVSKLPSKSDHGGVGEGTGWVGEQYAAFDFSITVYYGQSTSKRVLYSTTGTITAPYTIGSPKLSVTNPRNGDTWDPASSTVEWKVDGDASRVYRYWVYLSTDAGATYGAPAITAPADARAAMIDMPVTNADARIKVVGMSSSGFPVAEGESGVFYLGTGTVPTPGVPAIAITEPLSGASWYLGKSFSVRWAATGDPTKLILITGYDVLVSVNGGSWTVEKTVPGGSSTSTGITATVAGTLDLKVRAIGLAIESPSVRVSVGAAPTLTVSTGGYSFYESGMSIDASWSLSPSVTVSSYTVELLVPGQSAVSATVASSETTYTFTAPSFIDVAGCTLRVTANGPGVQGTSSGFAVLTPVVLQITYPSDRSTITKGTPLEIKWIPVDKAPVFGLPSRVASYTVAVTGKSKSWNSGILASSPWTWSDVPSSSEQDYTIAVTAALVTDARRLSQTVPASVQVKST